MKHRLTRLAALLIALLPATVGAQTFPNIPANTVIGRMGIGTGPSQAIPFASLAANLFNTGINFTQAGTGVGHAATGTFLTYDYNAINIDDNIATVDSAPLFGFSVRLNQHQSASHGGGAILAYQRVYGTGMSAMINDPASLTAYTSVESNYRGGTALAPSGAVFGTSIYASMFGAGIHLLGLTGSEVNVQAVGAGSTLGIKYGWNIVALTSDAIQGTNYDSAYNVSNQGGAVGWKHAFTVSDSNGPKALDTTGTIIATVNAGTVANGIDFSSYTITGNAWNSPGVFIAGGTGSGNLAVNTGIRLFDGTVTGIMQPSSAFTHSFAIGTTSNHPIAFVVNGSTLAGLDSGGWSWGPTYTQGAIVSNAGGQITSATLTNGQIIVGQTGAVPLAKTMSGDATLAASGALTLASTISAGGPTGSATVAPIITFDAKGRLTAVSSATITPAVSSITGFGTGVGAALALNVGSAGAPVLFNGALGTPSSGTIATTFLSGTLQAAQEPAHTGDVTNSAGSLALTIANNAVTLAKLATQATNTVLANATSGTAVPTALAVGSCSTAASALIWTTNTGFGCNTSITAAAVPASGLTGATLAAAVTASSLTSLGTITTLNATTINAHTLGGTISGGGNQINNVVIGASTPLAGTFTTLTANAGASASVFTGTSSVSSTAVGSYYNGPVFFYKTLDSTAGNTLAIDFRGATGGNSYAAIVAQITDQTASAVKGKLAFGVANGGAAAGNFVYVEPSGGLNVGTDVDPGAGTINATSGYKIGGVAGVTCGAGLSASSRVTNGIVTTC